MRIRRKTELRLVTVGSAKVCVEVYDMCLNNAARIENLSESTLGLFLSFVHWR